MDRDLSTALLLVFIIICRLLLMVLNALVVARVDFFGNRLFMHDCLHKLRGNIHCKVRLGTDLSSTHMDDELVPSVDQ